MHDLLVASSLAVNAPRDAGECISPCFGNVVTALDAFFSAKALGQTRSCALHAIEDSVLDLI